MESQDSASGQRLKVNIDLQFATYSMVVIAAAYHLGFWKSFEIDVFQFMALSDFPKLAIWPAISFVGSTALGFLFHAIVGNASHKVGHLPDASTLTTKRAKLEVLVKFFPEAVLGMAVLVIVTVILAIQNDPLFWFCASALAGFTLVIPVAKHVELVGPNGTLNGMILTILTLLPFAIWGGAKSEATRIVMGTHYLQASVPESIRETLKLLPGQELRYLASTGAYSIFLINSGPVVVVVPSDHLDGMVLTPITAKKQASKN